MKLLPTIALIVLTPIICVQENMRLPPNIIKQPTDPLHVFNIESSVRLECVATGTPKPNYMWFQDKKLFDTTMGNVIKDPETGTITIDPLYAFSEGSHQCRAENTHGAALSNVIKLERAMLADCGAPWGTPYTADQGSDLKVNCNAPKTVPDSTYTCSTVADANDRNMVPINTDQRINIDDKGNLYFASVMPSDTKNGRLYICNAYNQYVNETKHGSLSSITVNPVAYATDKEPEIMYSSSSPTVALTGKGIQLKCLFSAKFHGKSLRVENDGVQWFQSSSVCTCAGEQYINHRGNNRPSDSLRLSWSKVGGDLPTNRYELDQSNTTLTIRDVRQEDEASYVCGGTNSAGYSLQQIEVRVDSIPTFIDDTTKPRPTNANVGSTVSFMCDTISEPTADINWMVNGDPLDIATMGPRFGLSTDGRNLTIRDVCKDCTNGRSDMAVFSCQASNLHGQILANGYLNVLRLVVGVILGVVFLASMVTIVVVIIVRRRHAAKRPSTTAVTYQTTAEAQPHPDIMDNTSDAGTTDVIEPVWRTRVVPSVPNHNSTHEYATIEDNLAAGHYEALTGSVSIPVVFYVNTHAATYDQLHDAEK